MDRLLANSQIHSAFASLGTQQDDDSSFIVGPDAFGILDGINYKLTCEDQNLRTFRRAISFGKNFKMDLIPILLNSTDVPVIDATIRILVNLTLPIECLFSVDVMYRTEVGRRTIFEINKLLVTSKEVFTDAKTTKALLDYMKATLEHDSKLSLEQCESINNCLLLLRNILHIPENNILTKEPQSGTSASMQNIILWNLFIQSIDKLLIYLMSCPQRSLWGVTMVQLIALMYKDQHINTLQKLLNTWFDASLSDSSEDNESNTSPWKQGSGDSSTTMLTSDPTSDSSDNGIGKNEGGNDDHRQSSTSGEVDLARAISINQCNDDYPNPTIRVSAKQQTVAFSYHPNPPQKQVPTIVFDTFEVIGTEAMTMQQPKNENVTIYTNIHRKQPSSVKLQTSTEAPSSSTNFSGQQRCTKNRRCSQSEQSDCGYATQVENQGSISTSSNEDDAPHEKPVHHKPPSNQKQKFNALNNTRILTSGQDKKEWRRKKLVKRSKSSLIKMKGLVQHTPTDEDISNILKEFTVDFLLKGYNYLVKELHTKLLSEVEIQIDTSHFFWLITFFLKFATQLELDVEHINSVLSFDIVSYLTFEGIRLSEQLERNSGTNDSDLKTCFRRMHLIVTALREFLQALETYKKVTHLSLEDKNHLRVLHIQISSTEDLRQFFFVLIRRFNPVLQSKQYLQDLIVTNHLLLLILDTTSKFPENNGKIRVSEHIQQFGTAEVMHHYGILLEDFRDNGEFVNDCVLTMMHHVGGDLLQLNTLFQPIILKTFSQIWETEYELCDDWSDLIKYVINKFMNMQQNRSLTLQSSFLKQVTKEHNIEHANCIWSQEEMESLYWYYVQSKKSKDIVGEIVELFADNGTAQKSRLSMIQQLLQQDIITLVEYDDLMKFEDSKFQSSLTRRTSIATESGIGSADSSCNTYDDVQALIDQLIVQNQETLIFWLQKLLLECCFIKLTLNSDNSNSDIESNTDNIQIMEPVPYHYILKNQSIPLVPWNSDHASALENEPFVLLLHKLGLYLPTDAGKVYVRIPEFWTADILLETALKLGVVDQQTIKFDRKLLNCNNVRDVEPMMQIEEKPYETFAIPRTKCASCITRFTPDLTSIPSVPNWLELVMRNKSTPPFDRKQQTSTSSTTEKQQAVENKKPRPLNEDYIMESTDIGEDVGWQSEIQLDTTETTVDGKINNNMYRKGDVIAAVVYDDEVSSSCENTSVTSDLTRMYVSDEEDKHKAHAELDLI